MAIADMSPYEHHAWEQVQKWRAKELVEPKHFLPDRVHKATTKGIEKAKGTAQQGWEHVPGHDGMAATLLHAVEGLNDLVTDAALKTLQDDNVIAAFQKHGYDVTGLADLRHLDLEDIDTVLPDLRFSYSLALAGEGAAAGAVAGGGTMFASAGGIAGVGAGAVPGTAVTGSVLLADVAALLTASTRGAAHYAAYYGYDVDDPAERSYLVGTMSVALAAGGAGKAHAFAHLHKLVGMLARDATWKQLNQSFFVKYVGALYTRLGERLVKRKLGQALPIAGAAIGAGLNYQYARKVTTAAYWLGRERFLLDKYALHAELDPELTLEVLDVDPAAERLQILPPDETAVDEPPLTAGDSDADTEPEGDTSHSSDGSSPA